MWQGGIGGEGCWFKSRLGPTNHPGPLCVEFTCSLRVGVTQSHWLMSLVLSLKSEFWNLDWSCTGVPLWSLEFSILASAILYFIKPEVTIYRTVLAVNHTVSKPQGILLHQVPKNIRHHVMFNQHQETMYGCACASWWQFSELHSFRHPCQLQCPLQHPIFFWINVIIFYWAKHPA